MAVVEGWNACEGKNILTSKGGGNAGEIRKHVIAFIISVYATALPEFVRQCSTVVLSLATENSACACFTPTIGSTCDALLFVATFRFELAGFRLLNVPGVSNILSDGVNYFKETGEGR